jgi:outer membrane protein assembly factor BamE
MRFRLIAISVLLASCSHMSDGKFSTLLEPYKMDIRQGNAVTPEMRERLKFGMTRKQVHILLGTPLIADPFHANRWDYVYRYSHQGKLVEQKRLTLYFENDALVRIYDNGRVSNAPAGTTPLAPTEQQPAAEPETSPGTKQ